MKTKEVVKILEENKITNVGKDTPYTNSPPTIIHTKTFYCDGSEDDYDKHPRVHYTFNNKVDSTDKTDKGFVVCEYCYAEFVYEPKKKLLPLGDHWIPGVTERPTPKEEKTHSEEMQDKLEPIDNYVNKILKGSG